MTLEAGSRTISVSVFVDGKPFSVDGKQLIAVTPPTTKESHDSNVIDDDESYAPFTLPSDLDDSSDDEKTVENPFEINPYASLTNDP